MCTLELAATLYTLAATYSCDFGCDCGCCPMQVVEYGLRSLAAVLTESLEALPIEDLIGMRSKHVIAGLQRGVWCFH